MMLPAMLLAVPAGLAAVQESGFDPGRFELEVLATGMSRPMELAVAFDGRVFLVEQGGRVLCYEPNDGTLDIALELEVFDEQENGLLGIALDPEFESNQWVYLFYSPAQHMGQFVSRFHVDGTSIDRSSEHVVMSWIEQRRECCHHGGSLEFGPEGNLFISTGDNTNPFGSSGFGPFDERQGQFPWDAQRSSANTMTFGGKVLRIRPTATGGYLIPPGNLFEDSKLGRPEIYVMGCRNPWRISIDPETSYLYWGDVGPDASDDGERGPRGYDELNQARGPGFFGWPLFIGDNFPYRDYDFGTEAVGAAFDPARPWNDSPNNSGARLLPPAQPAWIYYPYSASEEFPELGDGGRTACAGPVYRFDPDLNSSVKFPEAFDGALFFYEWSRHWIRVVHLEGDSEIARIEDFPLDVDFKRPADLVFGPRGSLYVLEYGTTWGENEDSRLVRIDYERENRSPIVRAGADRIAGASPLTIRLSSEGTLDRDGDALEYRWVLQPGGELLSTEPSPELTIALEGQHTLELEVRDGLGGYGIARLPLSVGNDPPRVAFDRPSHGGFFDPEVPLSFGVSVRDLEDGESEGDADLAWWMDHVFVEAHFEDGAPPRKEGDLSGSIDPRGLALMKQSDCFNCHALEHRIVGPALVEIAPRYMEEPLALEASMERVREGSAGVWGDAQMLPHADLSDRDLRAMLEWIYELDTTRAVVVPRPGVVGEFLAPKLDAGKLASGSLVLEASYTDTGGAVVGPQVGRARSVLRTHVVEAEHFSSRRGTQSLDSDSASGGTFIGAIDHGDHLLFEDVDLVGIEKVRCRVSSAGAGATVEFRSGGKKGKLVGSFEMVPNGEWEAWFEVEAGLNAPPGPRDLYLLFVNEGKPGGLMNLDSLHFVQG